MISTCVICSATFDKANAAITCSPKCSLQNNRDRARLRMREKRLSPGYDKESDLRRLLSWRERNPHKVRELRKFGRTARSRDESTRGALTPSQWKITLTAFNNSCAYCGSPWKHKDHLIPLAMGGKFTKGNIVPACENCNYQKGAKNPFNFDGAPQAFMKLLEAHL